MIGMRKKLSRVPWALVVIMCAILAYGVIFVFSASFRVQEGDFTADPYKQVVWIALGMGVFIALLVPNYMKLGRFAYLIYGICLVLILLSLK